MTSFWVSNRSSDQRCWSFWGGQSSAALFSFPECTSTCCGREVEGWPTPYKSFPNPREIRRQRLTLEWEEFNKNHIY